MMRKLTLLLLVAFFPLSVPVYALKRRVAPKREEVLGRSPGKRLRKVKRLVEGDPGIPGRGGKGWELPYIW